MSDEKKPAEGEQAQEAPLESLPTDAISQNILKPIQEIVKTKQTHDETVRVRLADLRRLFKTSKGRGNSSLTEQIQLFAGLYGMINLKDVQDTIISQQLVSDIDRMRWHLFALQNYLLEQAIGPEPEPPAEGEELKGREKRRAEAWKKARDRIEELYKAEQVRAKEARKKLFEQHQENVLEQSIQEMDRKEIKASDEKAEKSGPKLVLPD